MISIIIPTINEAETIAVTITHLLNGSDREYIREIIVADGGSNDDTIVIAQRLMARTINVERTNRATQLNAGATIANSEIFFFLHADTMPIPGFTKQIMQAIKNKQYSGCFRLRFDHDRWFLKANAWFTKFDVNAVRFGDQGLFVTREIFERCGGFNEDLVIMEDQEIISRIKKVSSFAVLDGFVTTSARKYLQHGIYKTQGVFFLLWLLYYTGVSQKSLVNLYKKLMK